MPLLLVLDGAMTDSRAGDRVLGTTASLFGGLWSNRDSVKLADPGVMHLGGIEDDSTFLLRLIQKYYAIYKE